MPQRAKKHSRPRSTVKAKVFNAQDNTVEYTFVREMSGPERAAARRAKVGGKVEGRSGVRSGVRANGRRPRRRRARG